MTSLDTKLNALPKTPGVYFFKDKSGEVIYIGKAANLRSRVRQYFQQSRAFDPKTEALVNEIADVDWTELETELDAVFLEAEMVRRYMPRYNILLRDDKSFVYVRIDIKSEHPTVTFTRRPLDDGAEYLGPYLSKFSVSRALRYLRRAFPYSTHTAANVPKRACLQAQLGLCPGLEAGMTSLSEYRKNLKRLMSYLRGNRKKLVIELAKEMKTLAKAARFEEAAKTRDRLNALKNLEGQVIFGDREAIDISKDRGLAGLGKLLGIKPPRRIEGFDVSHMQGSDTTASMVVFTSGAPDKSQYRKFKSRLPGNDDFAHMSEVISRRFGDRNTKRWGRPDLILIDGGKGQVNSALRVLQEKNLSLPLIGLAKRFEEIIIPYSGGKTPAKQQYKTITLDRGDDIIKLLQRIRDESHRFAVSYHSSLKTKRQTASVLDNIAGIGPATRKKLIRHFGSIKAVEQASKSDISKAVGTAKANLIKNHE